MSVTRVPSPAGSSLGYDLDGKMVKEIEDQKAMDPLRHRIIGSDSDPRVMARVEAMRSAATKESMRALRASVGAFSVGDKVYHKERKKEYTVSAQGRPGTRTVVLRNAAGETFKANTGNLVKL